MEEFPKNHLFATHAVAAAGSVAFASTLTHPVDTLKSLLQGVGIAVGLCASYLVNYVAAGSSQKLSFAHVLNRVRVTSGLSGLYNGLGWSTLGRISGIGMRFGTYELLSAFYRDGREDDYVDVVEALLAGVAAGATEATLNTPFELLKLRSQLVSASFKRVSTTEAVQTVNPVISKVLRCYSPDMKAWTHTLGLLSILPNRNSNMVGALKEYPWMLTGSGKAPLASDIKNPALVINLEGWAALSRGLRSSIARDCVFGGFFFSTWQFLHIAMLDRKAVGMNPPPSSIVEVGSVSPLASSVAAGISGSVAAAASHCFDTAKTRTQCIVIPKYISMERKLLKWKPQGTWIERVTGISPADRGFLFRGIWLRMARSGIASFTIVGSYLLAVDKLF